MVASLFQFGVTLLGLSNIVVGCGSTQIGVLTDTDATANEVDESARLGSTVGVTLAATRPSNLIAKVDNILAWFERYLAKEVARD